MASRRPTPTDLSPLIAQVQVLGRELGLNRTADLAPYCDDGDPRDCDGPALERLLERLTALWAER